MKELESIWKNVSRNWRHLEENSSNVQNNINYIENYLKKYNHDIKTLLDWGPGGGFLAKKINEYKKLKKIEFVDVVDDHFSSIKNIFDNFDLEIYFTKYDNQKLSFIDIDLFLAFSVIYHFPSKSYADDLLDNWINVVCPKYFLIRNIFTNESTWENDIENMKKGTNYLRGVVYNEEEFKQKFLKNYDIIEIFGMKTNIKNPGNLPSNIKTHANIMLFEKK